MSEPTNQDLKELILSLEKTILGLDKKMATGFIELDSAKFLRECPSDKGFSV